MSTVSKDTTETLNSRVESGVLQSNVQAHPPSMQLHSDAVSLEVPLKVHGSKVTEIIRGAAPHTEPFEEQTSSMIVFPDGGVLRMATAVSAGQMLVLTNLKTRQDAICRVVKVRTYSNTASYVEVEFTHRQTGYWGVYFESDAAAQQPSTEVAPAGSEGSLTGSKGSATSEIPKTAPIPNKAESTFIPLGSQEDVQSTASSTASSKSKTVPAAAKGNNPVAPSAVAAPSAPVSEPRPNTQAHSPRPSAASNLSKSEQEQTTVAEETLSQAAPLVLSSPRTSVGAFGISFEPGGSDKETPENDKNWLLIAACAAVLLVLVGGGVFLFGHKSGNAAANHRQPATTASQAHAPAPPPAETLSSQATVTPSPSRPNTSLLPPVRGGLVSTAASGKPTKDVADGSEPAPQPEPVASSPAPAKTVPSVFGALNAHPVASHQAAAGPPEPVLDGTSPGGGDSLLGIAAPGLPSSLPPPGFNSNLPVRVGGRISEPRLLTHILPQYPLLALQAHTQGNVVVEIVIDKTGKVGDVRVVSGPTVLREAAVDAVRRWIYEPTLLDGQPIIVQMSVTIRFQL
jgi:periplasmic protein TonB